MTLTRAQIDLLLEPIKPHRVLKAQGQSHIAGFDAIAHLSRIFGFEGWDKEILDLSLVHERCVGETDTSQGRWWVTYRCTMRLTVRDPDGNVVAVREDAATGSSMNQPSPADAHDNAIKAAVTYATKRCAKDWGDQFGLSLYNAGMTKALVGKTLIMPVFSDGRVSPPAEDVQAEAPVPQSMGNDEGRYDTDDPERPFIQRQVETLPLGDGAPV